MPTSGGFGQDGAHKLCTATSKRSGGPCKGIAVAGSPTQKCRMHGGNAAKGAATSGFKHGRHSKFLPSHLDDLYREALSNPDLLDMADHIALLEAKIQDVLATQSAEGAVPRWSDLAKAFGSLETALLSGDIKEVVPGLEAMHKILEAGVKWDDTWTQVQGLMEQLRRLTDTEIKRKRELNQMIPVERVVVLMAAVGEAVKRNVTDPAQIAAVYRELALLHGSDNTGNGKPRFAPDVIDVSPRKRLKANAASTVET